MCKAKSIKDRQSIKQEKQTFQIHAFYNNNLLFHGPVKIKLPMKSKLLLAVTVSHTVAYKSIRKLITNIFYIYIYYVHYMKLSKISLAL